MASASDEQHVADERECRDRCGRLDGAEECSMGCEYAYEPVGTAEGELLTVGTPCGRRELPVGRERQETRSVAAIEPGVRSRDGEQTAPHGQEGCCDNGIAETQDALFAHRLQTRAQHVLRR